MGRSEVKDCARCLALNLKCYFGTGPGYCIPCNAEADKAKEQARVASKSKNSIGSTQPYQKFFNAALMTLFLKYLETNIHWNLASYIDSVSIISATQPTKVVHLGGNIQPWDNDSYMDLLDKLVTEASDTMIKAKNKPTAMIEDGLLLWRYLSFLVAEKDTYNGNYVLNLGLRFKITDLVLFRIDGLVTKVFKLIKLCNKESMQTLMAVTGLLRIKLHDLHEGLVDGTLTPIWDEPEFKETLKDCILETLAELNRLLHLHSLYCNREWREPLDSSMDNVFANVRLSATLLSFKREVCYVEEHSIWTPTTSLAMASLPSNGKTPVGVLDNTLDPLTEKTMTRLQFQDVCHQNCLNQIADPQASAASPFQGSDFGYFGSQFVETPPHVLWPTTNQYKHTRNDQVWNPDHAYMLPSGLSWGFANPQGVDRSQYVPFYGTAVGQTDPIRFSFYEGSEEWMEDSNLLG